MIKPRILRATADPSGNVLLTWLGQCEVCGADFITRTFGKEPSPCCKAHRPERRAPTRTIFSLGSV